MTVLSFYDTNILLYAFSNNPDERHKQVLARNLVDQDDWALSAQVLQEFYVNATRGQRPMLSRTEAAEFIELLAVDHPCEVIDLELVHDALLIQARYGLSYWDSAILAAASRSGAELLLSEDMNHGQFYGRVQVINPFISGQH